MKIIAAVAALVAVTALTPTADAAPGRPLSERINVCWSQFARDDGHSALPCVWYGPDHADAPQSTLIRRSGRIEYIRDSRARTLFAQAVQHGHTP